MRVGGMSRSDFASSAEGRRKRDCGEKAGSLFFKHGSMTPID